jgi:lipoate-protein ligase A
VGERWRRIGPERLDAARALARGGALLGALEPGGPAVLSWTRLTHEALVLGRSADDPAIDRAAGARLGVTVHRRASGGGAVLWNDDLVALDVALPAGHRLLDHDVVASYRWLGEVVAEAIVALGAPARVVGLDAARGRAPHDTAAAVACFGSLSPYEVEIEGRKAVGLSQVRRRTGGLLQVGIALRQDPGRLAELLELDPEQRGAVIDALRTRTTGVAEHAGRVDHDGVVAAVGDALHARVGGTPRDGVLTPQEATAEAELARTVHAPLTDGAGPVAASAGRD